MSGCVGALCVIAVTSKILHALEFLSHSQREIQCHFTCYLGFCHLLISLKTGFESVCMVYILMNMNKELMEVTELAK